MPRTSHQAPGGSDERDPDKECSPGRSEIQPEKAAAPQGRLGGTVPSDRHHTLDAAKAARQAQDERQWPMSRLKKEIKQIKSLEVPNSVRTLLIILAIMKAYPAQVGVIGTLVGSASMAILHGAPPIISSLSLQPIMVVSTVGIPILFLLPHAIRFARKVSTHFQGLRKSQPQ